MCEREGQAVHISQLLRQTVEKIYLTNISIPNTNQTKLSQLSDQDILEKGLNELSQKLTEYYYQNPESARPENCILDCNLNSRTIQQEILFNKNFKDYYLNIKIEIGLFAQTLTPRQVVLVADYLLTRSQDKNSEKDFFAHKRYLAREVLQELRSSNQITSQALMLEQQLFKLELPIRLLTTEEIFKLTQKISELLPRSLFWKRSLDRILNEFVHPENREFLINLLREDLEKVQHVEKDYFMALSYSTSSFHRNVLIELSKLVRSKNNPFNRASIIVKD